MSLTAFTKSRKYLVSATPTSYKLYEVHDKTLSVACKFKQVTHYEMMATKRIHLIADIMDDLRGLMTLKQYEHQLLLWDFAKKSEIRKITYSSFILLAKMSHNLIVVLDREKIHVQSHNGETRLTIRLNRPMKDMFSFWGAFVCTEDDTYIAVPRPGNAVPTNKLLAHAVIFTASTKHTKSVFRFRRILELDIVAMAFSSSSKLLAIAFKLEHSLSIRVCDWRKNQLFHSCLHVQKLLLIRSLFFSDCEKYVAVASNIRKFYIHRLNTTELSYDNILFPTSTRVVSVAKRCKRNGPIFECCAITAKGSAVRLMTVLPPNGLYLHYIPNFDDDRYNSSLFKYISLVGDDDYLHKNVKNTTSSNATKCDDDTTSSDDTISADIVRPAPYFTDTSNIIKYRPSREMEKFQLKLRKLEEEAFNGSDIEDEFILDRYSGYWIRKTIQNELDNSNSSSLNLKDDWCIDPSTGFFRKRGQPEVQKELHDEAVRYSSTGILHKSDPREVEEALDNANFSLRNLKDEYIRPFYEAYKRYRSENLLRLTSDATGSSFAIRTKKYPNTYQNLLKLQSIWPDIKFLKEL